MPLLEKTACEIRDMISQKKISSEEVTKEIIANAGKSNFLFKTASKVTATTINEEQVRKKNLARQLKRLLNTSKN